MRKIIYCVICVTALLATTNAKADLDSDALQVFMRYAGGSQSTNAGAGALSRQLEIAAGDPTLSLLFTVRNWDKLRPETRETLSRYVNVSDWRNGERTVSATAAFDTCETAVPEASNQTMDSTHFRAVYTTDSTSNHKTTTAFITALLTEAEKSWSKEVTQIGLPAPKLPSDNKLRIYVCNLLGNADGILGRTWTTTVNNADNTAYTFVELDNDYAEMSLSSSAAAEYGGLVFSHEFFHTIQFGINYVAPSYWLLESTATWVEDEVYPDSNDYIAQYVRSRFAVLDKSIDYFSINDVYGYGASIFFRHITENEANVAFMPLMWSSLKTTCALSQTSSQWKTWCQESVTETPLVDSTLASYGTDIEDTYRDFNIANYTKDYIDGSLSNFPTISPTTMSMVNDSASVSGELDHLAAKFYKLSYSIGSSANPPVLSFSGSTAADWRITAVLETQAGAKTIENKTLTYGNYSGTLDTLGSTHNSVTIIVNNTHLTTDDASFTLGLHNAPVLSQAGTTLVDRTITSGTSNVVTHLAQILTNKSGTITGFTYSNTGSAPTNKQLTWTLYRDEDSDGQIDAGDTALASTSTLGKSTVSFSGMNESVTSGQSYTYLLALTVQSIQSASVIGEGLAYLLLALLLCGFTASVGKKRTGIAAGLLIAILTTGAFITTGCGGGGGSAGVTPTTETIQMSLSPTSITMKDAQNATVTLKGATLYGPTLTVK